LGYFLGEGIEKFLRKSDGSTLFYNKATQEFAICTKMGQLALICMLKKDGLTG
jgi:hypothetical protein